MMKKLLISLALGAASATAMAQPQSAMCYAKAAQRNGQDLDISRMRALPVTVDATVLRTNSELFIKVDGTAKEASQIGLNGGGMTQLYKNSSNNDFIMVVIGNQRFFPLGLLYTGSDGTKIILQCVTTD